MARVLWFSLRFLLLYALLQAAFSLTPLAAAGGRLMGSLAAHTLATCMQREVGWSLEEGQIRIRVPFETGGRHKLATSKLGVSWYTRNFPMFLALILAAAPRPTRRNLLLLGPGLLAVVLLDGLIVSAHAWALLSKLIPYTGAGHVLSIFGVWTLGGFSVVPIFVGAALAFTLLDGSGAPARPEVARNAPCPCGSGRKYKRCCGATGAS